MGADDGETVEKLRQTKTKKQNARETEEGGASEGVCWEGGKKEGLGGGNEVTESERREGKKELGRRGSTAEVMDERVGSVRNLKKKKQLLWSRIQEEKKEDQLLVPAAS